MKHPKENKDPILYETSDNSRFVIGEIQNTDVYELYKRQLACFWVAESIDLSSDFTNFALLKEDEKQFLLKVLAFFAGSDGIVLENAICRFYSEVKQAEVRLMYGIQIAIENVHSETYTALIQALEKDAHKRVLLFEAINESQGVQKKAEWADQWMKSSAPFNERLVAFACVEGILFSASFASIFYFRKRGIPLPGLYQSNDYISRDEALHTRFAVLLHSQLHKKVLPTRIVQIVKSCVEVEKIFVDEALSRPILGMNNELMKDYVEYVADGLLRMFGCSPVYNTKNPFVWMEAISMDGKSNFFEKRVTEYSLADVKVSVPKTRPEITVEEDGKISFDLEF